MGNELRCRTCPQWSRYGLSIEPGSDPDAMRTHNLVANYLDRHPEIGKQYECAVPYFKILNLAEKELQEAHA